MSTMDPKEAEPTPEPIKPATADQMDQMLALFSEMVAELKRNNDILDRATALDAWRMGQGRHPDD